MELILSKLPKESGLPAEIWRDVPGFGGHYRASSLGRIGSKARVVKKAHKSGAVMAQQYPARVLHPTTTGGYGQVHIGVNQKRLRVRVHHMVLLAFVGPRPEGAFGCHNDGNPHNNSPDNLRWDDHFGNMQDRKRHGNYATGENHHGAKISEEQALVIAKDPRVASAISRDTGVSIRIIQRIKSRKTWLHLSCVVASPGVSGRTPRRGVGHPNSKLTDDDVRLIRSSPLTQDELAAQFGIRQATVWGIIHRKAWKHVRG